MKHHLTQLFVCVSCFVYGEVCQDTIKNEQRLKPKLIHAEPLYIDLIRDLGARKGEREWNMGFGMTDKFVHDQYIGLIEYEWAVADRLGLELELPFSVYLANKTGQEFSRPSNRLESLKAAAQWTFLVKSDWGLSMAFGLINELKLRDFDTFSKGSAFVGNTVNPFLVTAKQLGGQWHSLFYAGPKLYTDFTGASTWRTVEVNSNFHYMIPGSRNFVGIEFNKEFDGPNFNMVIRPQMRLVIHESLMLGIVSGIPVSKERERLSSFLRLIYEPKHR